MKLSRFSRLVLFFSLLLPVLNLSVCLAQQNTDPKPTWLVVTRPMFTDSLQPLAQQRQSQGLETVISTESSNSISLGDTTRFEIVNDAGL